MDELESLHVVDCVAPAHVSIDQYLPPTVVPLTDIPQMQDIAGTVLWRRPSIFRKKKVKIATQQEKA